MKQTIKVSYPPYLSKPQQLALLLILLMIRRADISDYYLHTVHNFFQCSILLILKLPVLVDYPI